MKIIILSFILLTQVSFAQSLQEFNLLSDDQKIELIYSSEFIEVDDQQTMSELLLPELLGKVHTLANSLVDVWGDTVLEGPYAIVQVDLSVTVESLFIKNNQIYAIKASVSNPAIIIESEDCHYSYESSQYTDECYEGIISQDFYLDVNGQEIESDNYADFDS